MLKIFAALSAAVLWLEPACAGTVVAEERNFVGNVAAPIGNFVATSRQTLITFTIDDNNEGGFNLQFLYVYDTLKNNPEGGDLWYQLNEGSCIAYECRSPLSGIVSTMIGTEYTAGMYLEDFDDSDLPIDNFLEITEQAVVPEPASWALLLCGFGLVGAALRHRQLFVPSAGV